MKTKRSGIERKLFEFPWLWAIEKDWNNVSGVILQNAYEYDFNVPQGSAEIWIYGKNSKDIPSVRRVGPGWDDRLGSRVLFEAGSWFGPGLQYVAVRFRNNPAIFISRAPRGKTFWEFLQKYRPTPQK